MPYVITSFGTFICANAELSLVHDHVPPGGEALRFDQEGSRLTLASRSGAGCFIATSTFTLQPKQGGRCSIRVDGHHLLATADGRIKKVGQGDEHGSSFLVISDEEYNTLHALKSRRHLSISLDRVISEGEITVGDDFKLRWAQKEVELSHFFSTAEMDGNSISFCYDDWKIEILKPYRPLIYFAAFGSDSIFSCLKLSCQSLLEIGEYDGDICIVTDKTREEIGSILDAIPQNRLHILRVDAEDVLDYTHSRFKITELPNIQKFSPILYMDTDIICNDLVHKILKDLAKRRGIACAAELAFDLNDEFYGRGLFYEDQTVSVADNQGISSGFFGTSDISQIRTLCARILHSSYVLAAVKENRRHFTYMDQPVFNYAVRKFGNFDLSLTDCVVSLVGNLTGPHEHIDRKGFLHFCGGVGNSWPKLSAMEIYLDYLRREKCVP